MDDEARSGGCLCGAINFQVVGALREVLHCHCVNCRRTSGNFVAATGCPTANLTVVDDAALRWHDLGYARYGFCHQCGSSLFWIATENPDFTSIMAGSLDDADGLKLTAVWFSEEAQTHHQLDPSVEHHAGNGQPQKAHHA